MDLDKPWERSPSYARHLQEKAFKARLAMERRYSEEQLQGKTKKGERIKIIVSGPVVERWRYELPVKVGKRPRIIDPETGEINPRPDDSPDRGDRTNEAKRTNARRSKMQLRRLVLSNFSNEDKFLTLTFRDGSVSDVRDVPECNAAFDRFLKRLRRKYGNVRYCRAIEFQDGNGRGAVHYHCIIGLPYVPYKELTDIWQNGNIDITAIDHVDNVGAYISKYMAKDLDDPRLAGKKAFTTGGDLVKPIKVYGSDAKDINAMLEQKKEVFANTYVSEYQGNISYTEYNMNRD